MIKLLCHWRTTESRRFSFHTITEISSVCW